LGCFFLAKINHAVKTVVNICMDDTQITIADLDMIKNVIDLASTRGAFRAAEMKQVGEVYDKLTAFLAAVVAQAQAQETQEPADTSEFKGE
jgi:hypothetical protein